jgi:drug/metabolite transporter (DMT)-like permease
MSQIYVKHSLRLVMGATGAHSCAKLSRIGCSENAPMIAAYDLLALCAAACWATTGALAVMPVRHLGAFAFTRWRMLMVAGMLWSVVWATGSWDSLSVEGSLTLAVSGMVGIFIGDTALFGAVQRLGPRRASVLFATHAAFSAGLGFSVLGERMGLQAALGGALTLSGVMCAIVLGRHKEEQHDWESDDHGSIKLGVGLGLVAALCQALSTLIAKPVMSGQAGGLPMDPIAASAVRVSIACAAHYVILWLGVGAAKAYQPPTRRVLLQTALNGFVGMGLGMTFILMALQRGDVGMVAILSSVTPVLVLPILWWQLRRAPAWGAWVGAGLTVAGTALILLR